MAANPPPTKRRREADVSLQNGSLAERSTRFWFADGNVVLQAEDTQFRVHSSLLSLHSEIMKDCFACPQPEDEETLEGCHIVRLYDSANNLCALLYGLYHLDIQGIDPSYLSTMMRLGRKYEITYFKSSALKYLRHLFPTTLEMWDIAHEEIVKLADRRKGFLFDVVNMAYENGMPSILPAAFLSLCMIHNLDEIISGIKRPEDEQNVAVLNPRGLQDCMRGRATFMTSFVNGVLDDLESDEPDVDGYTQYLIPEHDCLTEIDCSKGLSDLLSMLIRVGTDGVAVHFPRTVNELFDTEHYLCDYCARKLTTDFSRHRSLVWGKLGELFNLTGMEDLNMHDDDNIAPLHEIIIN